MDTLFTLISPTVRAHLHLLSRLAFVLKDQDFKAAVKRQASRDELMSALLRAEAALPGQMPAQNSAPAAGD